MTAGLSLRDGPGGTALHRQESSSRELDTDAPCATVVAAADLARHEAAAWDALVAQAAHPNPHYGRQVVEAHRRHGLASADLSVVVVRHAGRLAALLPFVRSLGPTRPLVSPYITQTSPLVADDAPAGTLAALAAGMARASGARSWRWPLLPVEEAPGRGLLAALGTEGWTLGYVARFARPVLLRGPEGAAAPVDNRIRERRKDLRRRYRRLAEQGTVTLEVATQGQALGAALEAFLALEARGWKGARGTALASRPDTVGFARSLFASEAAAGPVRPRVDLICLDGRPLAASLALIAGGTATLLKTAYDETARAFAPGVLLEAEIVRAFHETRFAERLDSASRPGSVLETLYADRTIVADLVAVPPGRALPTAACTTHVALARFQRGTAAALKRLAGRLR